MLSTRDPASLFRSAERNILRLTNKARKQSSLLSREKAEFLRIQPFLYLFVPPRGISATATGGFRFAQSNTLRKQRKPFRFLSARHAGVLLGVPFVSLRCRNLNLCANLFPIAKRLTSPRAERVVALTRIVRAEYVQTLCASHAPFGRVSKTKNFLTIPFSAGGVGGAGKKWKGKFLVLVPPLHSS